MSCIVCCIKQDNTDQKKLQTKNLFKMEVKVSSITKQQVRKAQEIHQLTNRNKKLYHPCPDKKGLHCEGERFDFVVNWEVREKETQKLFSE